MIDSANRTGIPGVTVSSVNISTNTSLSTTTNATGFYSLAVPPGRYNLIAKMNPTYYASKPITVSTQYYSVRMQNIVLVKKPTGTISGIVSNA